MHLNSTDRRDKLFLRAIRGGMTARAVATKFNVCVKSVYNGISRARLSEKPAGPQLRSPILEPLFPVPPFTPASVCSHRGAIRGGSSFCCMVCHRSGRDAHPALRRNPAHDPRPECKIEATRPRLTRRQRRNHSAARP